MSLPTSLVLGALVVAWLVVLVPMISKYRQEVPRSSDGTGRFRVLQRKAGARKVTWGRRKETDFADVDSDEWDDDLAPSTADLQQEIFEADDEYAVETAEYDDDFDAEYDDADDDVAPTRRRAMAVVSDEHDDEVDEYDHERFRPVPTRHGRGGYDPEHAEITRAFRFKRRRIVTLALFLLTLVSGLAAQFVWAPAWYATGIFGALFVGYLTYLRRQVKIEADISARRLARLRRARQIRPEYRDHRTAGPQTPDSTYDTRRQIVDFEDDDPAFDDLDYYQPVAYRRAVGE